LFRLEKVGKRYKTPGGEIWALRDLSLTLPSKGLVAVSGPSGSGKSTLLSLLAAVEKPTEGKIYFRGRDMAAFSEREREDFRNFACGFVYQRYNLLEELSALDNVALPLLIRGVGRKEAFLRAEALLKKQGLGGLAGQKAASLSGGEKQRLAILRALIGRPAALFADEPTGALDEANAQAIMAELKRLAGGMLVILVSHNERLIAQYAEERLALAEGRLVSPPLAAETFSLGPAPSWERGRDSRWRLLFLRRGFIENRSKHLLAFLAGTIGFAALLLALGFRMGSEATLLEERSHNLLYEQASLSVRTAHTIEGSPLSLIKAERPSLSAAQTLLKSLQEVAIEPDLSYFFPSYGPYALDGMPQEGAIFAPIRDLTLAGREASFLVEGGVRANDFAHCLVNEEFAALHEGSLLGRRLTLERQATAAEAEGGSVTVRADFLIGGLVREFPFLNEPRVYYSYPALKELLAGMGLGPSSAGGEPLTALSLIEGAAGDSPYSSYGYLLFASEREAPKLEALAHGLEGKAEGFAIASPPYAANASFALLAASFAESLIPFLALEVIGLSLIIGFLAYASFLERKKEAAILEALGARRKDRLLIYEGGSVAASFLAGLGALFLSGPLAFFGNAYLEKRLALHGLIRIPYASYHGWPLLIPLALVAFSGILGALGAGLPIEIASRRSLSGELRDE
jgi:ABC-type lipoprotein export system ATPase subunit